MWTSRFARALFVAVAVAATAVSARAAELLTETGVHIGGLVVNRVLPDNLEGDFYRSRKAQEETYLAEIARRFARLPRVLIRQLPRDVYGLASLEAVSAQLLA